MKEPYRAVLFVGPPACGKGTNAKRLAQELGGAYFSTGEAFRERRKTDSDFERKAGHILDNGGLLSDEFVVSTFERWISQNRHSRYVVLDGVVRTANQVEMIANVLRSYRYETILTLLFNLPDAACVQRMLNRQKEDQGRVDDQEEVLKTRLKHYHRNLHDLESHLHHRTQLISIDANRAIEEVYSEVRSVLPAVLVV